MRLLFLFLAFVFITAKADESKISYNWIRDNPLHEIFGEENAIYCRLQGPNAVIYHDGFGRCEVSIDRVLQEHEGTWKMTVGLPGPLLVDSEFDVYVKTAEEKPQVNTVVTENRPEVNLLCAVPTASKVILCKFRNPSGHIHLVSNEDGDGRSTYENAMASNMTDRSCVLNITEPSVKDMGIWRCDMQTENDIYYGFLKVFTTWTIRDPEIAANIITEPTLTASRNVITSIAGDSLTISCSVQAPIRYCYFRAPNGTIYNVRPGNSNNSTRYVGAGLDAGECGVRFSNAANESGTWTCNVLLSNSYEPEQSVNINVTVHEQMTISQCIQGSRLTITGTVYENRSLEYCRFVRFDGLGFISTSMPERYIDLSNRWNGICSMTINNPSGFERLPWTIVAKIEGQDIEISRATQFVRSPTVFYVWGHPSIFIVSLTMFLTFIMICAIFGSKNNREWTYNRANVIRNSFMRKTVIQQNVPQNNADKNSAMAA